MTTTIKYLERGEVSDVRITVAPINRSVTGYGAKLPTQYMVRIGTRWHRVYCICYSNLGSLYVERKHEMYFLSAGVENMIEDVRDSQRQQDARNQRK